MEKIEGEAGGLALGCVRGVIDSGGCGQGSSLYFIHRG